MSKYITGNWTHIFEGEKAERPVRIVIDASAQTLLKMEVAANRSMYDSYRLPTRIEFDDVEDSIVNANADVFNDPAEYGLELTDDLPAWAAIN